MSLQGASVEVIVTKGSFPMDQQFLRPCRVKVSRSDNTLLWPEYTHTDQWVTWERNVFMFHKRSGLRTPHEGWSIVKPRLKDSMRFKQLPLRQSLRKMERTTILVHILRCSKVSTNWRKKGFKPSKGQVSERKRSNIWVCANSELCDVLVVAYS